MQIGDAVVFIDSVGREFPALLTNVFGEVRQGTLWNAEANAMIEATVYPCVNLVYVSPDETKTDPYGRQLSRFSSMVHISQNSAGRNCWKFPDHNIL